MQCSIHSLRCLKKHEDVTPAGQVRKRQTRNTEMTGNCDVIEKAQGTSEGMWHVDLVQATAANASKWWSSGECIPRRILFFAKSKFQAIYSIAFSIAI